MLAHRKRNAHRKRARTVPRSHRQAQQTRRLWAGGRRSIRRRRAFFGLGTPQHVKMVSRLEPWLGGVAMLAGIVSWGAVLGLLGS